jgi:DNA-binding beta-propeller fold protein YncE
MEPTCDGNDKRVVWRRAGILFLSSRRDILRSIRFAGLLLVFSLAVSLTHAQQGRLLVAQKGEDSLGIVDPVAGAVIASVPEGGTTGHEVAASPDGRLAYVPIYGNSGVGRPGTDGSNMVVIDIAAHKVVGNVDFGSGVRPHLPVFGPKDGLLYVTTELQRSITIIDPKTLKIVGSIPTGQPESHMLALSHDGLRGYTANVGPGTVSVLDIPGRKVLRIIPISSNTQRISISKDDRWVFTADQDKPQMAVVDTRKGEVSRWIPLEGVGYGTAVTLDGRWLLVTMPTKSKVAVVDLNSMQVVRTVETPADPEELLAQPGGKTVWVSCVLPHTVAELDLATWTIKRKIVAGKNSDGIAWAEGR